MRELILKFIVKSVKETRLKMNIWLTIILVIGLSSSLQIPDVDLDYDYELSSVKTRDVKVSDTENFNYYDDIKGSVFSFFAFSVNFNSLFKGRSFQIIFNWMDA